MTCGIFAVAKPRVGKDTAKILWETKHIFEGYSGILYCTPGRPGITQRISDKLVKKNARRVIGNYPCSAQLYFGKIKRVETRYPRSKETANFSEKLVRGCARVKPWNKRVLCK